MQYFKIRILYVEFKHIYLLFVDYISKKRKTLFCASALYAKLCKSNYFTSFTNSLPSSYAFKLSNVV